MRPSHIEIESSSEGLYRREGSAPTSRLIIFPERQRSEKRVDGRGEGVGCVQVSLREPATIPDRGRCPFVCPGKILWGVWAACDEQAAQSWAAPVTRPVALVDESRQEKGCIAEVTRKGKAHLRRGAERQQEKPAQNETDRRTPDAPARIETEISGVGRVIQNPDGFVRRGVSCAVGGTSLESAVGLLDHLGSFAGAEDDGPEIGPREFSRQVLALDPFVLLDLAVQRQDLALDRRRALHQVGRLLRLQRPDVAATQPTGEQPDRK